MIGYTMGGGGLLDWIALDVNRLWESLGTVCLDMRPSMADGYV